MTEVKTDTRGDTPESFQADNKFTDRTKQITDWRRAGTDHDITPPDLFKPKYPSSSEP